MLKKDKIYLANNIQPKVDMGKSCYKNVEVIGKN